MFTFSTMQLIGIVALAAGAGSMLGFFAMAALAVSGRCSAEEERRPWPGEVK